MTDQMAISVLKMIETHGILPAKAKEKAIEALEKQVPKKVSKVTRRPSEWGSPYLCPECEAEQIKTEFFTVDGTEPKEKFTWCSSCGQKLDWGDSDE